MGIGRVSEVMGGVIDVGFEDKEVGEINNGLEMEVGK
ncbi:hypothetical protein, partial [Staphylococcus epidermidis]